jgi:AraC-like DNA-binding protein
MPYLELTGLTRVPLLILERAPDLGLDREKLLARSGLTHQELSDPDGRVPLSKISGLWQAAVEQDPDPSFGLHLGESVDIREIGLVGYVLLHSRTAREALQRLVRYSRVIQEALKIRFEEDSAVGQLSFARVPLMDRIHHPADARLAVSMTLTRKLTGADVVPVEVGFPYPRPDDTSVHRRIFRAPLKFDCPDAHITLAKVDLDRSIVAADETLVTYLDRLAEEFLESLSRVGTFSEKVRRAVWTDLSDGHPNLEGAATRIGVSPRSLQRRLKEEGTTFAEILDDLRHRMAMYLLRDQHLAVYEVAFLLGYSEPSTFFRAFRRWESKSPREYRAAADQDEEAEVPDQPLPSF